jgi:hypothetical protein
MKSFDAIVLSFLILASCTGDKEKYVQFRSFEFDIDRTILSDETVNYSSDNTGVGVKLTYCSKSICSVYWLMNSGGMYVSEGGDTLDLLFDGEVEYLINDTAYVVKKYTLDRIAMDSESQHYWSPEFGIIMIKTTTWGGYKILTRPSNGNHQILSGLVMNLLRETVTQSNQELTPPTDTADIMTNNEFK